MSKQFASTGDMAEKTVSFTEIGPGLYAFTAEGDPNTGVIVGDDSVMVIDAQATPAMAGKVIERIRQVTDKPVKHVVLSHYHAVRVLGASGYGASEIIASDICTGDDRGARPGGLGLRVARFPRLFQAADTIPGLTWPSLTFSDSPHALARQAARRSHVARARPYGRRHRRLGARRARDVFRRPRGVPLGLLLRRRPFRATGPRPRRTSPARARRADAGPRRRLMGRLKVAEAIELTAPVPARHLRSA
jgi:hypothetical protein